MVDSASDKLSFGNIFCPLIQYICRSGWPRGLRRGLAAVRLPILRFRIPPAAWMSVVSVVCFQVEVSVSGFSGRGLCVGLVTCSEESYRLWCV